MYLLRFILIFLIVYMIIRAFIIAGESTRQPREKPKPDNNKWKPGKGVPKSIGEYIDYEETDKSA